eukprot:GHVU01109161.1.p1 GENE.GHVU01109161.1~~GHVU01109161.1.p1  ORF type:complete len:205 (+),score=23.46 GHVU01109161.1:830-1444(+)
MSAPNEVNDVQSIVDAASDELAAFVARLNLSSGMAEGLVSTVKGIANQFVEADMKLKQSNAALTEMFERNKRKRDEAAAEAVKTLQSHVAELQASQASYDEYVNDKRARLESIKGVEAKILSDAQALVGRLLADDEATLTVPAATEAADATFTTMATTASSATRVPPPSSSSGGAVVTAVVPYIQPVLCPDSIADCCRRTRCLR